MPDRKKALIAGATGVVGRNLLRHLLNLDDWDVIAVSRRKPDVEGRYEHVAVDLLDQAQTFEALKRPRGVSETRCCGAFAFFKLHHRVDGGGRGACRHGLVPASERLCILAS
jgi:NAD(P)-dependent dehydrogenase (short-subunit alcohol dehydrogenase family)